MLTNSEKGENILKKIKNEEIPNPRIFIAELIDCLTALHKESEDLLIFTRKEKRISEENTFLNIHTDSTGSLFVEHDPGKWGRKLSDN